MTDKRGEQPYDYGCSPMNFQGNTAIKYYMRKILPYIKISICFVLCAAVCIAFPCMAFIKHDKVKAEEEAMLSVWQIDNFEGGKGSRADFLQKAGGEFSENNRCFVTVLSLSAESARLSLSEGNVPDLISYGAGIYGIENFISGYKTWCQGGYCLLSTDTNTDFSDVNSQNTVVNEGKDNLSSAAALTCGLQTAVREKSTGAYVKLINGDYKYLLGTQRDIYRLKTRGVAFTVKPITQFNDLYQNISVTTESKHVKAAKAYIEYLMSVTDSVNKLGLIAEGAVYDDEMKIMQNLSYDCKLVAPVSLETRKQIESIISDGDINMLKNLLK